MFAQKGAAGASIAVTNGLEVAQRVKIKCADEQVNRPTGR